MDVTRLQAVSSNAGQTLADNYQTQAGGGAHAAVVKDSDGGYRAYVIPSLPGISASGSSVGAAEANLNVVLNLLA